MRYELTEKISEEFGIDIHDILAIDWSQFNFPSGYVEHTITKTESERVDVITYRYYGTVDYEDIVFLINKIPNLLDLQMDLKIKIPKLSDIGTFIRRNKGLT